MPHLFYMNRYWMISSDDFPIFISLAAWIRFTFIAISVALQLLWNKTFYSHISFSSNYMAQYFIFSTILLFCVLLCESLLITRSFIGTLIDEYSRYNQVVQILNIRYYFFICQAIFAILGIITVIECHNHHIYPSIEAYYYFSILIGLSVVYHIVDVVGIVIAYRFFSYPPNIFSRSKYDRSEFMQQWKLRCLNTCYIAKLLTCGLFGGRFGGATDIGEDVEAVASLLTDLLHHEGLLDVVFTDIIAGMILVGHCQQLQHMNLYDTHSSHRHDNHDDREASAGETSLYADQLRFDYEGTIGPSSLGNEPETDAMVAEKLYKYCVYSCTIYSFMLRIYINPCKGVCLLTWYAIKSFCTRICCCIRMIFPHNLTIEERYALIEGSDPCGTHRTAIGDWTSQELDTQLIHSNITISTKIKPYAVFYDAEADEVVIAIRGTLTLEDCVTDAMTDPVQFDSEGFVRIHDMTDNQHHGAMNDDVDDMLSARWAHEGMLICALSIRDDIIHKQILKNLSYIRDRNHAIDAKSPLTKSITPQFRLVIVGHSLGAGIASILAMLMRSSYPNLRCYTYGTPGSVVDRRTAYDMRAYVTSVVLADDLVCRSSYHSLISLKIAVLDCISRVCANKMRIFQSVLTSLSSMSIRDYLYDTHDLTNPYHNEFQQSLLHHISNNRQSLANRTQPRLFHPGRIIHIKATRSPPISSLCCFGRSKRIPCSSSSSSSCSSSSCLSSSGMDYHMSLSSMDDFNEIMMSSTMAWDHFPDRYLEELKRLAKNNTSSSSSSS